MNDLYYEREASLSDCGNYRWSLSHNWDPSMRLPWIGWVMLNPSTADATIDDPTIRRCVAFSQAWGFGGMTIRNLFALRATDPDELARSIIEPVGEHGDKCIRQLLHGICPLVVCAWGTRGGYLKRDAQVMKILREDPALKTVCLGKSKGGHPWHPLYIKGDTRPIPFVEVPK